MPTRIFTPDQLAAIGVPNPYDAEAEQRAEHLFDEQIDTRRWVSMHHLVFRGPDDGKAWRVEYVRGLTESQDGISPWEYAGATVEAVEVEQVATTVMEWHAIPDAPAVPSDAELIEHARTLGMVEPERAPEFVAAFRAQVEERSAAAGTQPVPLLDGITAEEAAANIAVNAPALAATGHMAAAGFARGIAQAAIARPDVEEQPAPAVPSDLFTEAAIRHSALTAGADAIKAMAERDPWKTTADAVKLLRRMAAFHTTAEQPTGLTWEARTEHAVRLYATTAIELEDARRDAAKLRERLAELEQDQADADTIAPLETAVMEHPEPTDLTERPEDTARRFARRLNAVERLCSGRPGYHTITVKQLLTAMSDADDGPDPVTDDDLTERLSTAVEQYLDDAGEFTDTADLADNLLIVIKQAGR